MTEKRNPRPPRRGDWLEVNGIPGYPPRRGEILEVLGSPGHPHYRVRWDDQHESLHFPAQGTTIIHRESAPHAARAAELRGVTSTAQSSSTVEAREVLPSSACRIGPWRRDPRRAGR